MKINFYIFPVCLESRIDLKGPGALCLFWNDTAAFFQMSITMSKNCEEAASNEIASTQRGACVDAVVSAFSAFLVVC